MTRRSISTTRGDAMLDVRAISKPYVGSPVGSNLIIKNERSRRSFLILGMGREVAILRCIRILFLTTTNLHDLPRTVLLDPTLDLINGL